MPIEHWASCFYHAQLDLYLAVYVDDFKLAGPVKSLDEGWKRIRSVINMEPQEKAHLYLGCIHEKFTETIPGVGEVTGIRYNMESYLSQIVSDYEDIASDISGSQVELKTVATPFLEEDCSLAEARAPHIEGSPGIDCPHCRHSFSPIASPETIDELKKWMDTYAAHGDAIREHAAHCGQEVQPSSDLGAVSKQTKDKWHANKRRRNRT